jgi:drug/metabolite transporter (DMT)-like permease
VWPLDATRGECDNDAMPDNPAHGKPTPTSGRLLLVLAAVMWSTSGFFAKAPFFDNWPIVVDSYAVRGPVLAFWRALFASLVLLPLVRRPRWTPRLIPAVLIFAAMNVTYLSAMTQTTAANAIWLQNTAPVWVFLVSACCWREKIQRRDLLLLVFAVAGVGLILCFELQGQSLPGIIYGLLGGMTYAGVVLSLRWLRDEDPAWLIALNHIVTAAILLPYVAQQGAWPSVNQTFFLCAFGMLQMGIPYWLFARAVQSVSSQEAAGIVLLEPLLVPIWVFLAWRHSPGYQDTAWWTIVGGGLILAGLVIRFAVVKNGRTVYPSS